ncbi:hypothetical protein [Cystobacter ferrugineus]|uniref:Uncharacterized protein n=1 Tax=Cystobacter ferrugineus TaxID=83449 RepID=A0A1L9BK11_9BACT|nr:hypothetical protein [Cystobacter ferrugineus]OJH42508.1 hypothetical protein BON30_04760 [Cystobacter ferrugineus]
MRHSSILSLVRAESTSTRLLLLGVTLLLTTTTAHAASAPESPDWDRSLPELRLRDVTLSAGSLQEAWQLLNTHHLVRSVLFVKAPAKTTGPFFFNTSHSKVRDVLNALVKAYPDFTWTADPQTGVLWIHPRALGFGELLSERLRIPRDACAVPLQTGVLLPLGAVPGLHIVPARWGSAFTNTFDTAVELPQGDYRLRDLLTLAIKPHPTKTLYIQSVRDHTRLSAVHIGSDKLTRPPEGALLWWWIHFAELGAPTRQELAAGLASSSPAERTASREYLEAIAWQLDLDALVREVPSSQTETLWTSIGVASVLVRHPAATHVASLNQLESLLPDKFSRPLMLLARLERARLAGEKQLPASLSAVKLEGNELEPLLSELLRLAALSSGPARELLEKHRSAWMASPAAKSGSRVARCLGDSARPWSSAVSYERATP